MEQIGRYQIQEELGRGTSGVVYRALDPTIGRTIAIKCIALGQINESERERIRERLLREARSAGVLSHPNIITIYDVLDRGESLYIFMEFVEGQSLETMLREGHMPGRRDFLTLLHQIAGALDYAHRKGIIHRDVKPANVVIATARVASEPIAKMGDFGVAKVISQEATHQGGAIGTPSYMSPEQIQGTPISGASDEFSLAVLTYEAVCGHKPFVADNLPALFYQICKHQAMPAHLANSNLTPTVSKVFQRAMAKKPDERFSTCSEFIGALEFALGDCPWWTPARPMAGPDPREAASDKTAANGFVMVSRTGAGASTETSGERAYPEEQPWVNKMVLLLALFGLLAATVVFIVRMNSGRPVTVQVLDSKNGAVSPPPPDDLRLVEKRSVPPLDLTPVAGASAASAKSVTPSKAPVVAAIKQEKPQPPTFAQASAPSPPKPVLTGGSVDVLTDPPGATITLDKGTQCATPCTVRLPGGRHTLSASLNGFEMARKIFYTPTDARILIPMTRSLGVLLVSSEPSGSNVNVDGAAFGHTPVTLRLAPGAHRVSVWDGTRWHDESVQIEPNEVYTRAFHF